jgi:putative transposase
MLPTRCSLRHSEEMMQERGVFVDHATVHRWAIKMLPVLVAVFRRRKHPVGKSWRMDETYIRVAGWWKYLYRAVDRNGDTVDFLLNAKRDTVAAAKFFEKAMKQNVDPQKVAMDKSGANKAAIDGINEGRDIQIEVRLIKYLNNIVEQDHRSVKRITKPMLGFKSFSAARAILAGIELMHMIRKGQMIVEEGAKPTFAEQFYAVEA